MVSDDARDFRQRPDKSVGHLLGFHFTAAEDENSQLVSSIGIELRRPVTNSIVLGQDNPAAPADLRQPIFVRGVLREMPVMDLDPYAALAKFVGDDFLAQGTVDKKDVG